MKLADPTFFSVGEYTMFGRGQNIFVRYHMEVLPVKSWEEKLRSCYLFFWSSSSALFLIPKYKPTLPSLNFRKRKVSSSHGAKTVPFALLKKHCSTLFWTPQMANYSRLSFVQKAVSRCIERGSLLSFWMSGSRSTHSVVKCLRWSVCTQFCAPKLTIRWSEREENPHGVI